MTLVLNTNFSFWLIWHTCQRAYRIMICPSLLSSSSLSSSSASMLALSVLPLSTLLITETSYLTHICIHVPSQSRAKIVLLWPLFSNWQPYCVFLWTFLLGTKLMIQTSYLAGLCTYIPSLCMIKISIDSINISSLAAIFVFS